MMDDASGYEVRLRPSTGHGPGEYRMVAKKFVENGRRRELWRAVGFMVALVVVQFPMRQVAVGRWTSATVDPTIAGRLSLLIDVAVIVAELTVAYRAWGLVRSRWPARRWIVDAKLALILVCCGAALDVAENIRLWMLLGETTVARSLTLPWHSHLALVLSVTGLVFGLFLTWWCPKPAGKPSPQKLAAIAEADAAPAAVICCSGGGIRASAFSLGGLAELQKQEIYQGASAIVGVSGGGYIAAAHHVVRWRSGDESEPTWNLQPDNVSAFASGSPELQYLRRHTRYIMNSVGDLTQAALSLAFGIAVNVLLMTMIIGGTAWLLAWLLLASGRLKPWAPDGTGGIDGQVGSDWTWLNHVWWVPVAGVVVFLFQKFLDRFVTLGTRTTLIRPARLRILSQALLLGGAGVTALLIGVPLVASGLADFAATSAKPVAGLLYQLGFVSKDVCTAALDATGKACGVSEGSTGIPTQTTLPTVGSVSLAAVVSSILAVLASARSASGAKAPDSGGMFGFLGKVWAKVKDPVIPYAAVTVIVLVVIFVLLRWVTRLVADPLDLDDWWKVWWIGVGLVCAKVFTDANRTSLHYFFRERISDAFLVKRTTTSTMTTVDTVDYRKPLRFSESRPPDGKGPRLVSCAVANVSDEDLVPSKRGCTPFVFDDERMGLTDRLLPEAEARRRSQVYEFAADDHHRDATVPAAIAISAAAFSPLAGRENVRLGPYRAVLALGNARLGVWLPNPMWVDERHQLKRLLALGRFAEAATVWANLDDRENLDLSDDVVTALGKLADGDGDVTLPTVRFLWARRLRPYVRNVFKKPSVTRLFKEAVGKASAYDRFLYVTDGGHYDNLGLLEALRRKPSDVYVLDASNDKEDTFSALGSAIATARMDLDCELDVDPRGMRRLELARSPSAWCSGTYEFKTGEKGRVHVAKAIMLDGLPWDVETYAAANEQFPRTSTSNQLYSEFDFEAYRELGASTVRKLLNSTEYQIAVGLIPPPQVTGDRDD